MINLLPPEIQMQIKFSKYNVILRRYVLLTLLAAALLGSTILAANIFADQQISEREAVLAERQDELDEYEDLLERIEELDGRLSTISRLYDQQTRFSALLDDLASVLPSGAFINSVVLTGEADQPLQLTITAQSFSQAGTVNHALSSSERIESVDIQSINESGSGYSVSVVLAFDEGGAR